MFSVEIYIILFMLFGLMAMGIAIIFWRNTAKAIVLPSLEIQTQNCKFKAKISKPKLVNAIIEWCRTNIGDQTNQPNVQISYHPHRKKYGCYIIEKKLIRIYIKNHKTIESLAQTIIHEFVHYIEIKSDKESKNYARFQHTYSYETNPYERSANQIAAKFYQQCLHDLCAKGLIVSELPLA